MSEIPAGGAEHLRVHPSVVFKLGEDLITDEVQALVELVKNSYDADSPYVRVVVDTGAVADVVIGGAVQHLTGSILVEDRGVGMSRQELIRGWLTVSNSWKKEFKSSGVVPPHQVKPKRAPLGDKGLGRLGAQRLGDVLEVETRSVQQGAEAWHVVIPWRSFDTASTLDEVPIFLEPFQWRSSRRSGTTLRILGLKSTLWTAAGARDELRTHLAALISPFGQKRGFIIEIILNGEPLDLHEVGARLRAAAELSYKFSYKTGLLNINANISRDFFRPNLRRDLPDFERYMEADDGHRFRSWLTAERSSAVKRLGVVEGRGKDLFVAEHRIHVNERSTNLVFENHQLVDPGPFAGEVDAVDLGEDRSGVFDSRTKYREFVRAVGGIGVFRDGFGIRTPGDWLNLGARWSTGKSFYSLRPDNVIGYIDISVKENAQLEETTDREGFRATPAYQNFYAILQLWLDYTADLQDMLRRSWVEYQRAGRQSNAEVNPTTRPEDLLGRVDRTIRDLEQSRRPLRKARDDLAHAREQARRARENGPQAELDFDGFETPERIREALRSLEVAADRIVAATSSIDEVLGQAESVRLAIAVVKDQLDILREQLADSWATVALGITAEALTHEMLNVVDRLRGRTSSLQKYLRSHQIVDRSINTYLEHVRTATSALAQQLDHLDPSLSYSRGRRDLFSIASFLDDFESFFKARYVDGDVRLKVSVVENFSVSMSRGQLTQVLDNLVLNSEYWIRELQRQRGFVGIIEIICKRPCIVVSDNGPGVSPSIEDTLFEPFVTTKPRDRRGRGLGLYVVRQLLDADGCTIRLLPDRDPDDRRRRFEISLEAVAGKG
jgi:signal transduction histidine kinase